MRDCSRVTRWHGNEHDGNSTTDVVSWTTHTTGYRLPTEAEWEYAVRANTTTEYCFGNNVKQLRQYAWYADNARQPHPVGQKQPNPWGLYDMHGNVWEWVWDCYAADYYQQCARTTAVDPAGPAAGSSRVNRGGSWLDYARDCRSTNRVDDAPVARGDSLGFRLLREVL